MNICFATYQSVLLLKGGPRTQIIQTKRHLENLNVKVSFFETWNDFKRNEIECVHIFGANIGTYHLAREIHKLGIPIIITPIFYTRRTFRTVRAVSVMDFLIRRIARGLWSDYGLIYDMCTWAKLILPNTKAEAKLLIKGLGIPEKKIIVIPNGVDENFYHASPDLFRETYGIDKFILNVGHVGPERKNILRLIYALEEINHPAVIIGRIEKNEYGIKCLETAKRNSRLTIIDSIPSDSRLLASAYAACDVFVLPSLYETPGIAALEAGIAGAKIVITKYGGTDEYFGSHAIYVSPYSIKDIRNGIQHALKKEKDSMLRESIREKYLWSNVAKMTFKAYKQLF